MYRSGTSNGKRKVSGLPERIVRNPDIARYEHFHTLNGQLQSLAPEAQHGEAYANLRMALEILRKKYPTAEAPRKKDSGKLLWWQE